MLAIDDAGIARAAELLRAGGLVAFPTETVYGLGADATDDKAVAGVFAAKDRPGFNPLIVHLASAKAAARYADPQGEAEALWDRLAATFWPGPLTLVVPLRQASGLSALVTAGRHTVALRVPAHPVARRLLEAADRPVAAPSANRSGRVSPTSAAHVLDGLGGRINAILDGGSCPVGVESTIISLLGSPALLRPGGLPLEDVEACLGRNHVIRVGAPQASDPDGAEDFAASFPLSPGQMASHYAPEAGLRLGQPGPGPGDVWIGFGPGPRVADGPKADGLNLSRSGDLVEAAANLFAYLRRADALAGPTGTIAVAPIPERGLGRAINDRLRRAAAPR